RYFADPLPELHRLARSLGLDGGDETLEQSAAAIRADLRHSSLTAGDLVEFGASPEVIDLYRQLCSEAGWTDEGGPAGSRRRPALSAADELDPAEREELSRQERLAAEVRRAVRDAVPSDSIVLVLSRGDEDLLRLGGQDGWHFPRDWTGGPLTYPTSSSLVAIANLEALRAKGAGF